MEDLDAVALLAMRNLRECRITTETSVPERKPRHGGYHGSFDSARANQMAQTLLDKYAVSRLRGVLIEAGKNQQPDLAVTHRVVHGADHMRHRVDLRFRRKRNASGIVGHRDVHVAASGTRSSSACKFAT
jgi:hypothetical protein